MPQLSYNQVNNNKRFSLKALLRPLLVLVLTSGIYTAGFYTPTVLANRKYAPAQAQAKAFIAKVTSGDYAAATNLGTDAFKEQFKDPELLKVAIGDLKTDNVTYKDSSETRVGDYYQYSQVVDGLPKNPAGLTDAGFNLDLVNINGNWQVASVVVE